LKYFSISLFKTEGLPGYQEPAITDLLSVFMILPESPDHALRRIQNLNAQFRQLNPV
jgi:hypothetical protein